MLADLIGKMQKQLEFMEHTGVLSEHESLEQAQILASHAHERNLNMENRELTPLEEEKEIKKGKKKRKFDVSRFDKYE